MLLHRKATSLQTRCSPTPYNVWVRRPGSQVLLMSALVLGAVLILGAGFWLGRATAPAGVTTIVTVPAPVGTKPAPGAASEPTQVYAHNLLLRKGPHFRLYIRWIRGHMLRTKPDQNPSFDAPDSFLLEIQKGVIRVNLNDISDYLNSEQSNSPLKKIAISGSGDTVQLRGTVHKLIPIPVQLEGTLLPLPDGRLRFHLARLSLLKVPMKGLLGVFHVKLSSMVPSVGAPGIQIAGNDILFDTEKLLPPPHIHGRMSSVTISGEDLQVVYGNAGGDEQHLAQWHNFLRLSGGSLDFGKLTMRQVDLTMIDASKDPWFDLDLVNYQAQLVYGTTRMTSKAGLEIYMPDVDSLPAKGAAQGVTLEWLRNRNTAPPLDVPAPAR